MILRKRLSDLCILVLLLVGCSVMAQKQLKIGTNTNSIGSSAVLELESTTKGFLLPRMNAAQKAAIVGPVAGLQIWCTDCGTTGEMQFYNGSIWFSAVVTSPPVVTTADVTSITATTATGNGTITNDNGLTITARGVCYTSTAATPTITDTKTTETGTVGTFTSALINLTATTTYNVRAYATTASGTFYGNQVSFATTNFDNPVVTTAAVTTITTTTATAGGSITNNNGRAITARGVCWSTVTTPTLPGSNTVVAGTTGSFTSALSGLTDATLYYVRAYATTSAGTTYGTQVTFTTQSVAVATTAMSSITNTTASSGGSVTNDSGVTILARGVCYNTATAPTINNPKTTAAATSTYTSALSGLTQNTTYYVRAYVTTNSGTVYGGEVPFTTLTNPTLVTATPTNITTTTASSGGTINNSNGWTISARGVVYSTTDLPTVANPKTTDSGNPYASSLSGLTKNTPYYVRAYTTMNTNETFYGNQVTFTTANNPSPVGGNAVCDGNTITAVNDMPISANNKIWMDRNLGASRAAQSSNDFQAYGCLYQWGRGNDGHASINWTSGTAGTVVNGPTPNQSAGDNPGNNLFVTSSDWRSSLNNNLWQAATPINNPCNAGYRVPTEPEFRAEVTSYNINSGNTAFSNGPVGGFKFVVAGYRDWSTGNLGGMGTRGYLFTSTTTNANVNIFFLDNTNAGYASIDVNARGHGFSVRCIKN